MASKLLTCLNHLAFESPIPCVSRQSYFWVYIGFIGFLVNVIFMLRAFFKPKMTTLTVTTTPNSSFELITEAESRLKIKELKIQFCETQKIPVMVAIHKGVLKHHYWCLPYRTWRVKACESCQRTEILEDYIGTTLEKEEEEEVSITTASPVTLF